MKNFVLATALLSVLASACKDDTKPCTMEDYLKKIMQDSNKTAIEHINPCGAYPFKPCKP